MDAVNHLILDLAAVSGLIHDGMIRSPAWRLLDFGRRIERASNVAHLLKSLYSGPAPVGRPMLKALLEGHRLPDDVPLAVSRQPPAERSPRPVHHGRDVSPVDRVPAHRPGGPR